MGSPQSLSETDRRVVAAWAADCAEHVLALFHAEAPDDDRLGLVAAMDLDHAARLTGRPSGRAGFPGERAREGDDLASRRHARNHT